jgi:hypothetical protein
MTPAGYTPRRGASIRLARRVAVSLSHGASGVDSHRNRWCDGIGSGDRPALPQIPARVGPDLGGDGRGSRAVATGDELLEAADIVATRAIRIDAPAEAIWPWLVQMGPGRPALTRTTESRTSSA